MKYLLISLTAIILFSCSQYTCPSINGGKEPRDKTKRFTVDVMLKKGTITDSLYVKTVLISVHRTMLGNKHLFISDHGDSIVRYENKALKVGECYLVLKNI